MPHLSPRINDLIRKAHCRLRKVLFYDHWMIGIIDQPLRSALTWTELPPVRWLKPDSRKRYLADPFPWPGSPDTFLCEDYNVVEGKGRIIALKLKGDAIIDEMPVELPLKGHLSYPFLFMLDGRLFMMPESCADKKLEIFAWEKGAWLPCVTVLQGQRVADAVLFEKDGLLWISYTDVTENPHDNLYLIYAKDLAGPWRPHAANPVRHGVESSRNGGAVFEVDGKLYRLAQDCSKCYGGALRVMEIVTCTPDVYLEKEVTRIAPSSSVYPDGVHTLSAWGNKCLVDGMRVSFCPRLLLRKVLRRLGFCANGQPPLGIEAARRF